MPEENWYWSEKDCIETLKRAICAVAPDYFNVELPDGEHQHGERIFAYELYHQMRLCFPSEHGKIHGEYRKALWHVPYLDDGYTFIPDLVLHQSASTDKNLLAIEIKTSVKLDVKDLIHDLGKLEYYTRRLEFKIGIMLLVNTGFVELVRKQDHLRQIPALLRRCSKVAVWNIETPLGKPNRHGRSLNELDPNCLRIFRARHLAAHNL